MELARAAGDRADAVAEGRGRDHLVQRRTEGAGRRRARDGAHGLGTQQLLELSIRVTLGADGGAAEVDFGGGSGRDVRLGCG